jgi:hypothetical protein
MTCPNCNAGRRSFLVIRERGRTERDSITCLACNSENIEPVFDESDTTAQRFTPIVIDRRIDDPTKFSYPGAPTDKVPAGYERIQITNLREADRWTKHIDSLERERTMELAHQNEQYFDDQRKANRAAVDEEMRRVGMDRSGRARWMRDSIRRIMDAKLEARRKRERSGGPNFNIQVFSKDAANREGYANENTNWRQKRV